MQRALDEGRWLAAGFDSIAQMGDGAASATKIVGATLAGKYRIVQHLRTGGIANVYLAEMLTLRPAPLSTRGPSAARTDRASRLALKVLRQELAGDRAMVRRFERGALAAARIVHPNVVRMGPIERLESGLPFCTMEVLVGLDLADALEYVGRLEPMRAVRIAESMAAGLAAAHAAGVVHLDVKPENVFLVHEPDGRELVKILDFGLASLPGETSAPRVDAACSTPEYMAPEQRRGVRPSPAMDIYALGVVLREMLTGHAPSSPDLVDPSSEPRPVPPGIARVVERAIATDPAARFASMEELRAALVAAAEDEPAARSAAGRRARGSGER